MQATSWSFLQILSTAALVAASACSGELRPESAVTPVVPGGFVAPDGWSFPPGQVVPTYGAEGMVSTTDRVASEIGVEVLRSGGNAVDAAVAIHFALAVVNPEAGNIGGGGFMVVRMADGRTAALDFREKAPRAATRDMYLGPAGSSHQPRRGGSPGGRRAGVGRRDVGGAPAFRLASLG